MRFFNHGIVVDSGYFMLLVALDDDVYIFRSDFPIKVGDADEILEELLDVWIMGNFDPALHGLIKGLVEYFLYKQKSNVDEDLF